MKHVVICLLAVVALAGISANAFECYLKMQPAILGESTAEGHTNEIALQSFAFELNHPPGAAGQRSELMLSKLLDKASPVLALRCADGTIFQEAIITCRSTEPGRPIFYRITLTDVAITRVAVSAETATQSRPGESAGLQFNRIRWEYWPILPDGTQGTVVRYGWDFQLQRPF